ncbi:MAG: 5-(carboxyamino)imidazole ribonucleotide synthase [Polyangiaceae bacterium]
MARVRRLGPGATIGILGGGQLGRMTAMAARELGYHIRVLDPDPSCAARFVVEECITAPFDDEVAAAWLAHRSDVITLEIEKISLSSLRAAEKHAPVHPSPAVLEIIQDRVVQKAWLEREGFPVGAFRVVSSAHEIAAAFRALHADAEDGGLCFVKAATGGYDGRGQVEIRSAAESQSAFDLLAGPSARLSAVVEKGLPIEGELSVLVARSPSGEIVVYPPAKNHHEERILKWSVIPAPIPAAMATRAAEIGRQIAVQLDAVGLLVVELFVLDGELLVNELAPRPHNSFHATQIACATSQFEQHARAVCDMPLGSAEALRPAAIVNLLGDLWVGDGEPAFHDALSLSGVRLHLYGKRGARPGRKIGHLSATAATSEGAVELALAAFDRLKRS